MRKQLKRFIPTPLWQAMKLVTTVIGWRRPHVMLTTHDIAMLEKWGRDRRSLVEIGLFEGGSALVLRSVIHPEAILTLIDPFVPDSISGMRGSYWISRVVVNRNRRGCVEFIRDFSFNAVKNWSRPLDFVFIDGDHSEQGCRQDFDDWEPHVSQGGVILFHDSRKGQPPVQPWMGAEGSTKVVNELFRHHQHPRWRIIDEGGSIVAIQRV
jgi:predicted O-methyltransferase YrrM